MPFVQREVRPKYLSRVSLHDEEGRPRVRDGELEAVTNYTLSSALRQLASVVRIAKEVFDGLNSQLVEVADRTRRLRTKIDIVEEKVSKFDPKTVTVPESDLTVFSGLKEHYKREECSTTGLFTASSRPVAVQRLYEGAAVTPVPLIRDLDRYRRDGTRSSKYFSVTPVLGGTTSKRRKFLDIETRKPAVLGVLRRWTSSEALGSVTVDPDCTLRVSPEEKELADHTLPSPEEQLHAVALKFPAEVVRVDVSGKNFMRMSNFRRSLMHVEFEENGLRKRGKNRRPRGKRRNTIAGTDCKELEAIVGRDSSDTNFGKSTPESGVMSSSGAEKKSHLENLKEWGRSRLRQIRNSEPAVKLRTAGSRRKWDKDELNPHSSSGNWSASSESGHSTATSHIPRSSISSGSTCLKHKRPAMVSTSSSVTSESTLTPDDGETCSMYSCDTEGYYTSFHLDSGLKTLREEEPCPAMHCTSALSVGSHANISSLTADSEYELFGKGSTSTTASSNGTVCTTLLVPPAPERICSQLSGNKTLPERNTRSSLKEIVNRETQSLRLDKRTDMKMLTFSEVKQIKDSHLKINNTSSLESSFETSKHPASNMITVEIHNENRDGSPEKCGDSPDSGHNTCSSPVDSVASPSIDLEMSECSDLEGVDRMERIRVKTTINSSRIPSMCVITPPQSDDEVSLNHYNKSVDSGEYVTIADVRSASVTMTGSPLLTRESEYISLNELPPENSLERKRRGARVTLDAEGKVVYSSDSLRRKKTTGTFEPGPCVISTNSPVPPRQINVRPVQIQSPLATNKKTIVPSTTEKNVSRPESPKVLNTQKENNNAKEINSILAARRPLSPVSPNRTTSPVANRHVVNLSNSKQYFPKSAYDRVSPSRSSRPLSPLVSPTNISTNPRVTSPILSPSKATSPKMVVKAKPTPQQINTLTNKGAYVKVLQPSDDQKFLVKRSDSYRQANDEHVFNPNMLGRKQYGPGVIAGPSLLTAIQAASNNKAPPEHAKGDNMQSSPLQKSEIVVQSTWPRSTSTPTKPNSESNLDFTTVPSPIHKSNSPTKNSRSAMDLFAIIHESKKRIQNLQKPVSPQHTTPPWPKSIPGKVNDLNTAKPSNIQVNTANIPQPMPPLNNIGQRRYTTASYDKFTNLGFSSLPRMKVEMLEESPKNLLQRKMYGRQPINGDINQSFSTLRPSVRENQERQSLASDRHGSKQPTSRNDFKRLLLQTGLGPGTGRGSAVDRLKNKTPEPKPWKYDVLSTTIPEDCGGEDEQKLEKVDEDNLLKSSVLVNAQNRAFQSRGSPTLETAL